MLASLASQANKHLPVNVKETCRLWSCTVRSSRAPFTLVSMIFAELLRRRSLYDRKPSSAVRLASLQTSLSVRTAGVWSDVQASSRGGTCARSAIRSIAPLGFVAHCV